LGAGRAIQVNITHKNNHTWANIPAYFAHNNGRNLEKFDAGQCIKNLKDRLFSTLMTK